MASSKRRRFISGAVCPGCGTVDKVFVVSDEAGSYRGCTQCEFQERLEDLAPSDDLDTGVQVIKLFKPADS
jgi:uncharacterized metal-binding protein (TIGR02443 family)